MCLRRSGIKALVFQFIERWWYSGGVVVGGGGGGGRGSNGQGVCQFHIQQIVTNYTSFRIKSPPPRQNVLKSCI